MNKQVDLTNCDREPIHIPGSIQPFGFLLGLQSDFTVCMASENVADYLGRDCADIFQRPVAGVLSKAAVDAIRARVDYLSGPDASERIFGVPLQDGGIPLWIAGGGEQLRRHLRGGLRPRGFGERRRHDCDLFT